MKVVIDTNGLLNAIPKRGSKRWLYQAFIAESFIWVFSNEILTEYDEVICRKFSQDVANYVISSLLASANHERFEPPYKYQLVTKDHAINLSIALLKLMLTIWSRMTTTY